MVFAKLLKLRDKLTRKRQQLSVDEEKPFLEHLEDLRKMLMRMAITLVLAMMISMFWYSDFMKIVQWPAQKAGLSIVEDKGKPDIFDQNQWEQIKEAARTVQTLSPVQRDAFFAQVSPKDPTFRKQVEALLIYKAGCVLAKPVDIHGVARTPSAEEIAQRDAFFKNAVGEEKELNAIIKSFVDKKTKPDIEPLKPAIELVWRKPSESFFTAMKLALYAGLLLAFPFLFYFLMEFVLPGLTPREKKLMWPALAVGFGLFLTGLLFAFFWVVPRTLQFFHDFSGGIEGTKDLWTFADYTSFVTVFSLVFGASFELPVVVLLLVKLGLLNTEFMRRTRRWAIFIIVMVAAVITPTGDPGTLAALALPMILMYEACIWISVWMEKMEKSKEAKEQAEYARERAARALALPTPEDATDSAPDPASSGPPSPVLHPEIQPYRNPHEDAYHDHHDHHGDYHHDHHESTTTEEDHAAWLLEQQEIYRQEHAHLFTETEITPLPDVPAPDYPTVDLMVDPEPPAPQKSPDLMGD